MDLTCFLWYSRCCNLLDPVFDRLAKGQDLGCNFEINGHQYKKGYYLADDIYPTYSIFVKTIHNPVPWQRSFGKETKECSEICVVSIRCAPSPVYGRQVSFSVICHGRYDRRGRFWMLALSHTIWSCDPTVIFKEPYDKSPFIKNPVWLTWTLAKVVPGLS